MTSLALRLARGLPFYYGWVVVAVSFITLGLGYTARSTFSLLFPPILAEFGWDRGMMAGVFSVGFFSAIFYAPLIGYWLDRIGPQAILPLATVVVSSGFALTTVSSEPWQFVVTLGIMVVGATTLLAFNSHFVFVPNWFEAKRGFALGLVSAGVGVFSILALPWFQWTIDNIGWRAGCWAFACLLMLIVFPLTLLLQRRAPQDLGLNVDGGSSAGELAFTLADESTKSPNTNTNTNTGSGLRIVDIAWVETEWTLQAAMGTARFWLVSLGFATSLFCWYAIMVHQTQYLLDLGFDSTLAALALGILPVFGMVGQIGLGSLSDRIGREWVWTLSSAGFILTSVLLLALQLAPSVWLVFVMVGVQGCLGYALPAVYGSVPADIFQGRNYGIIYGTMAVFSSIGAALGPWAFGIIYDVTGSYNAAFLLEIVVAFVSALSIWLAAPRKVRSVARNRKS